MMPSMATRILALVAAAVLLLASDASARTAVGAAKGAACRAVRVGLPGESGQGGSAPPRFSARETEDIVFTVTLPPSLAGEHLISLKVSLPGGHLYQQIDLPIAPPASRRPGIRRLEDYPHPVEEILPRRGQTAEGAPILLVDAVFPVGGTAIGSSSLYGRWRVEAFADGAEKPCARRVFFIEE